MRTLISSRWYFFLSEELKRVTFLSVGVGLLSSLWLIRIQRGRINKSIQFNRFSLDSCQTGPTPAGSDQGRNNWVICKLIDDKLKLICRIVGTLVGFEPWTLAGSVPCCCRWPRLSLSETLRCVPCGGVAGQRRSIRNAPPPTLLVRRNYEWLELCDLTPAQRKLL